MDLLCSDHLTSPAAIEEPAVTIRDGYALCASCARERERTMQQAFNNLNQGR